MTLPLPSLTQRYQQLMLGCTHRGNHQSSVISKYIWWCKYLKKEVIYIINYIYKIFFTLFCASLYHQENIWLLMIDDFCPRIGRTMPEKIHGATKISRLFDLRRWAHRAVRVSPRRRISRPSACTSWRFFIFLSISYLQKEEARRNQ